MLKPILQDKMLPEHRLIYNLNMPLSDEALKERIITSVRHIRRIHCRNGVNKLQAKLDKYGNNGGWYRERVKEMVKSLYKQKKISNDAIGRWRSIEFELVFKSKEACEEFGYAVRAAGLTNYVTIQDDASIKRNSYDLTGVPHEIVLSYRVGDEDAVRSFCKCLRGRAYVNQSCGTHFHIDARNLDEKKVTEYGNRLAQAVPALRLLLPRDRRENKFCQKNINTTDTECVRPYKYAFINLAAYNKHKTIEVRGHSGTINAEKILNWIRLCEHIMLTPFTAPAQVNSIEKLIELYQLDKELISYVKERFMKFNDEAPRHSNYQYKTEGEEAPAEQIDIPIHPVFLIPVPPPKNAQAAPKQA